MYRLIAEMFDLTIDTKYYREVFDKMSDFGILYTHIEQHNGKVKAQCSAMLDPKRFFDCLDFKDISYEKETICDGYSNF